MNEERMTPEQFVYWLQGFFELKDNNGGINAKQVQIIEDHLSIVFNKVTPNRKPDVPTPAGPIDSGFSDEWKKIMKDWEKNNKTAPLPQYTIPPFWEIDKKTYNPNWPLHPEIICSDKAWNDFNFQTDVEKTYCTNTKNAIKQKPILC